MKIKKGTEKKKVSVKLKYEETLLDRFFKLYKSRKIERQQYQKKIDVVYTYVNYEDTNFKSTIQSYKKDIDLIRFRNYDEIYLSLETIETFMKNGVDNIYIVTFDQQLDSSKLSDWIKSKIIYIYHSQIIPKEYLPTFNSISIESFLHNIPDLSNTFLYLNDDMFLGNYLTNRDLYDSRYGITNIFIKQIKKQPERDIEQPWLDYYINTYEVFQSKFPVYCNIKPAHCGYMMDKNICREVWEIFGKELSHSITQFRESKNIVFWFLCYLYGLYKGVFYPKIARDNISIYFHCDTEENSKKIEYIKKIFKVKPLFFNINNVDEKCIPILNFFKQKYLKSFKNSKITKTTKLTKTNMNSIMDNMQKPAKTKKMIKKSH